MTLRSRHYCDVDDVTGDGVDVNGGDVDVHGDDVGVDVDCLNGCVVADDGDQGSIEARMWKTTPPHPKRIPWSHLDELGQEAATPGPRLTSPRENA